MTKAFRTPDDRFADLEDFPYAPSYRTVDDLRLAHIDEGEGPPVVMLHGEPAWSYIWRKLIPPLREAGYRCIAPDHAGFGRSDKPIELGWQSLQRHVELTGTLIEELDLRDATLVVHDWGGPIGLTLAVANPDRVARIVILDTVLDSREAWLSETWVRFREFIEQEKDLPIGEMMRSTCFRDPGDAVAAAYDAPFPTRESLTAVRDLPMSVPRADDEAAVAGVERLCEALRKDRRPTLMLWGEQDLFLTLATGQRLAASIGRRIDHVIPKAGHGLQEDAGEEIGGLIVEWLGD